MPETTKVSRCFANVLIAHRKKAKLSQDKLAAKVDLDRTYISLLERGLRQPSLSTILALAEAFQVPAHVMIQDVEKHLNIEPKQKL